MKQRTQSTGTSGAISAGDGALAVHDEISRLRHANAVTSEVAASLRAQRDHDQRRSMEQAALLYGVATQLQSDWRVMSEGRAPEGRRDSDAEAFGSMLEDLRDYTGAWSGTLALESEPVHLGTFIRQIVAQACTSRGIDAMRVTVSVPQHVPERVRTDVRCLSKILLQLVGMGLDRSDGRSLSLQIYREGWNLAPAECVGASTVIALTLIDHPGEIPAVANAVAAAPKLREALATRLRDLMGASLREDLSDADEAGWFLTLPLEASVDPARASELERANADQQWGTERPREAPGAVERPVVDAAYSGAIDFLYLDRQLGSLAQLVLARTAPAFLRLTDDRLTSLVVAHELADLDQLRDLAQIWKASAMTVGGRQFAELLGAIEKQAAAGHLPGEGTMRPIWDALKQLEHALQHFTVSSEQSR